MKLKILVSAIVIISFLLNLLPSHAMPEATSPVYFDLVVDEGRQILYGSVKEADKIDIISMSSLQVIDNLVVGSGPAGLDLSPDGKELAVALSGNEEIAFIDLDTHTITHRLTPAGVNGPNIPYDVLYGRPGRLYSSGNNGSGGLDYIHVFDTVTKTEVGISSEVMRAAPRLAITADQNSLYVSQVTFSPQKIYLFDISTDAISQTSESPHGPTLVVTLCVHPDGRVFSSRSQVWSADLTTQVGSFPIDGDEIECASLKKVAYISSGSKLASIHTDTYQVNYEVDLVNNVGVARLNADESILYISTSAGVIAWDTTTYSVSGTVRDEIGNPMAGVKIQTDQNQSTVTDSQGFYEFPDLLAGTYILTPSFDGYSFTPSTRTVTLPLSAVDMDFTASPIQYLFLPCLHRCLMLYSDDFSNSSSGWPADNNTDRLFEYRDGEYRILVKSKEYGVGVRPGFQAADYIVYVDVRNINNLHGSYGLAFGIASDWSSFYTLEIYPDGWFGLYRWDPSSLVTLAEAYSSAILQGTATNRIKIMRSGSTIKAYANDVLLTSLSDGTYMGSRYLGLVAFSYDQKNVDIRYDNFNVYPVACGTGHNTLSPDRTLDATFFKEMDLRHLQLERKGYP